MTTKNLTEPRTTTSAGMGSCRPSRFEWLIICALILVYIVLAVELARVRPPRADEGDWGNAAAIFASRHYLAMPMLNNIWLPGLDKHLYPIMPLYFVSLAGWFKMFGVGIITMRLFSVFWGVIGLVSWYMIVRALSHDRLTSILALLLIGLNYDYANLTSFGRYEAMFTALNSAALAVYLLLREDRLQWALLFSNTIVAAAFLTHPNGFFGFVALALFAIVLDRDRIRWKQLVLSATPYVIALLAWGAYIARDPATFRAQFSANVAPRLPGLSPLTSLAAEVRQRYLIGMAGWVPGAPLYKRVETLILLAILVSVVACLLSRHIRQERGYKLLIALTAIWFLMLTYLEPLKEYGYVIQILPLYFVLMAIWVGTLIKRAGLLRGLAVAGVGLLSLFAVAAVAYRVKLDCYHKAFLPAAAYLQGHLRDSSLVMAAAEFGFELGFDKHVNGDWTLGYLSRKTPEYFVIDKEAQDAQETFVGDAPMYAHIKSMIADYKLVFTSNAGPEFYHIYARPR